MRSKIFFIAVFLLAASLFVRFSYAQTEPTAIPTGTGESDLGQPYSLSCVQVDGIDSEGLPPPVDDVTFSGNCGSSRSCYIAVCSMVCENKEERTNSKGETVLRCVPGDKVEECTVFNSTKDMEFFRKSGNYGFPRPEVDGANSNMFPPGDFSVEGKIRTYIDNDHKVYSIYALSEPDPLLPADLGLGGEEENNNEENPSVQLGTAPFTFPTGGQSVPAGTKQKCVSVVWDPYGRVFDAISLEPLNDGEAKVSLYHENGSYVQVPSNGSLIDNLGKYNIFVEKDGKYTLKVDSMLLHNFEFIDPDSRYKSLYSTIYQLGDPAFTETRANPKRMDIPVKPKSTPYRREVAWIYKNQNIILEKGQEFTKIDFRVSHPLTKIKTNIKGGAKCAQTNANYVSKEGFCLLVINNSNIPQGGIKIELIKNPDYYLYSGKKTMYFDPILRLVDGYVYDDKKEIIPGAKVGVVLMNDKVFYQTTADDSGFFTIYKNNLPPQEYYLKFTDPASFKSIKQTTTEFIKNNQSYVDSEKVNMMTGTKNNQLIVNPKTGKLNEIVKGKDFAQNKLSSSTKSPFNPTILVIVSIISLLLIVTLGIIFYIKKSK